MDVQKRAPSIDMASIELENTPSPAPTYSSTFIPHGTPSTPQHATLAETSESGASINPYCQPTTHDSPSSTRHPNTRSPSKDAETAPVKPDYQDTNHPHFARSDFPTILPPRGRMPQTCILVPWVLFAVFFLITIWFTSILLGAKFLSIIHPTSPAPIVQEVHFYFDGEALKGTASVSTRTVTLPSSTVVSTAKSPSPTELIPGILPDMSKGMDRLSTPLERRTVSAPTGFTTIRRRGP